MMYGIGNRSGLLAPTNFTITYMILRTNYKNIVLGNISDFTTIMEEVKEHRSPAFKLTIVETKYDDGEEAEEDEDTEGPTDEEMEQNEAIANLTRQYTCEDRACGFHICWPAPPEAKHVNLTLLHLNTWAAAMVGLNKQPGVDLDNPPNTKIFDVTYTDPTDIAMLSRRRLNAVTQTQSSAPSIVINNDFKDIVGLLNGDRGPDPAIKNAPQPVLRQQPALRPKLSLLDFCNRFKLSRWLCEKLDNIDVTGPHCLRFLQNADLLGAGLSLGELADIRDAEERWMLET
ncbi:hypothetical protein C8R48DRAFT_677938 [Suillus tomentosus]|nr:hypothetical protein C8R48DRAFT_677938 [Suillus tomentosus]